MKEYKDHNLDLNKEGYAKWQISNGQKYLEVYAPDSNTLGHLQGEYLSNLQADYKRITCLFFYFVSCNLLNLLLTFLRCNRANNRF